MKLMLHIGTEKTGSSFLQTLAARNRAALASAGVFFPSGGKREKDMQRGRVSPGNGKMLYQALAAGHPATLDDLLTKTIEETRAAGCQTVLWSNENIIEQLARPGILRMLEDACSRVGIDSLQALLVLRDPADQALSLYKHRVKSGEMPPVDEWMRTDFHTLDVLGDFLQQIEESKVSWTFRKYQKDGVMMSKIFFEDWLQMPSLPQQGPAWVNPSLTLSELLFLKSQRMLDPDLVPYYYEALLAIDPKLKADDSQLEVLHLSLINREMQKHEGTVTQLNNRLGAAEALTMPLLTVTDQVLSANLPLSLSEFQVGQLVKTQKRISTVVGRLQQLQARLKKLMSTWVNGKNFMS